MSRRMRRLRAVVILGALVLSVLRVFTSDTEAVKVEVVQEEVIILQPLDSNGFEYVTEVEIIVEEEVDSKYTQEDINELAKLLYHEARGESYGGKLAVATVVVNRSEHYNKKLFGGPTIQGVIYHKLPGAKKHQFDAVDLDRWSDDLSGEVYDECVQAAEEVLIDGYRSFRDSVVYYYNPKTSTDSNFINSVRAVSTIGRHVFAEII